jgi:hypothetical protein
VNHDQAHADPRRRSPGLVGASGQSFACSFVSDPLFITDPEMGEGSTIAMSAPTSLAFLGLGAFFVAWWWRGKNRFPFN